MDSPREAQNKHWPIRRFKYGRILWSACSYRPEQWCKGMFSATPCMWFTLVLFEYYFTEPDVLCCITQNVRWYDKMLQQVVNVYRCTNAAGLVANDSRFLTAAVRPESWPNWAYKGPAACGSFIIIIFGLDAPCVTVNTDVYSHKMQYSRIIIIIMIIIIKD